MRCVQLAVLLLPVACASGAESVRGGVEPVPRAPQVSAPAPSPQAPAPTAEPVASVAAPPSDAPAVPALAPAEPCPPDMVFVDTVHCPDGRHDKVGLTCLKSHRSMPNNHIVCERFAPGQVCRLPPRRQRFCIDRYEYPSREGAHPPAHVSAYDAAALCASAGKRMCYESEWTAACEGPDKLPFPYGLERSSAHCNIDQPYLHPKIDLLHHADPRVAERELLRVDQSTPSGGRPLCRSGFGVYDLTGNFDEWVLTESRRGASKWAGLKGGGWGHVRNACRPITTSHVAQFIYYSISTRCCGDPDPAALAPYEPGPDDPPLWLPPPAPVPSPPGGRPPSRGWTPPGRG